MQPMKRTNQPGDMVCCQGRYLVITEILTDGSNLLEDILTGRACYSLGYGEKVYLLRAENRLSIAA